MYEFTIDENRICLLRIVDKPSIDLGSSILLTDWSDIIPMTAIPIITPISIVQPSINPLDLGRIFSYFLSVSSCSIRSFISNVLKGMVALIYCSFLWSLFVLLKTYSSKSPRTEFYRAETFELI